MKLYNIYWRDLNYVKIYEATTNNLDKWLEDNNKDRGDEPERLSDFEIEVADVYIYEEEL